MAIKHLQEQIDLAIPWFKEWKISIDPTKTQTILVSPTTPYNSPKIKFQNKTINLTTSVKYFGVTIDSKLIFSKHTSNVLAKTNRAKSKLFPILNKKSPLPLSTKLYIYKSYIKPIFTYASPARVTTITEKNQKKLEKIQSKILRTITKSPWYLPNLIIRNSTGIETVEVNIRQLTNNILTKIQIPVFKHNKDITNRHHSKERFHKRPLTLT